MEEKTISEKESLQLIASMINKAKDSYHDRGLGAILWGSVIAVCSIVQFMQIRYDFELPIDIYWLTAVALIPQIFFTIKEKKGRLARSHNDVVMDYLWLAFAVSIFLLVHVNGAVYHSLNELQQDYRGLAGKSHSFQFSDHVLSYFLILYGFPTFVTGAIMQFKPMLWGGLFCWVCSVVCVYTNIETDLLLTALSAILAWLIPGIVLRQKYLRIKKTKGEPDV